MPPYPFYLFIFFLILRILAKQEFDRKNIQVLVRLFCLKYNDIISKHKI